MPHTTFIASDPKSPVSCLVSRPGSDGFACSGLLLPGPERWVLTHGAILGRWLKRYPSVRRFVAELDELTPWSEEINIDNGFEVIWHDSDVEERPSRVFNKIALAWRCPLLSRATRSLLVECVFEDAAGPTAPSPAADASLRPVASIFVLLCDAKYTHNLMDGARSALARLLHSTESASSGAPIRCISTPFGAQALLTAVSEGVISRLAGPKGVLMLTDASAAPGCEGAPIYSTKTGEVIGLVTFPMTWWRGEWLGFTLAASLRPILEHLLLGDSSAISSASALKQYKENISTSYSLANQLSKSVALVRRGEIWGSGVLVSQSTLLTCSHIFAKAPITGAHCRVEIGGCEFPATVIFRTADNRPYDVAILKLKASSKLAKLVPLEFSQHPNKIGDSVWAAGYPTFRAQFDNDLVVTRGIVSRVTRPAHAVATTCCIQSGHSGGPLLRPEDLKILGMVVSNAKEARSGAIHPRINMAVPAMALREPIEEYLRTQDTNCLSVLEQTDPKAISLWAYREPSKL